ncbi:hypothetical protein [Silvibacterium dinghuense]|uniref:Peptidase M48 domain-containing protein n=1 Tax=Silvibacterium dinghuense TaxID=1560006 RepID=A0A4Q1SBC4_9BACT|nr:hypothetical protein [Silvibacterium dinghuense]RXS94431.1 hypothetical protein ESZ00_15265 [Silvibacterium dinghuense]GGH16154.1 hypothetical protein GCM10011586_37770 [Silvibacterium dinghuense]
MYLRKFSTIGLALMLGVSAAYAKKAPKYPPPVPLTPEQSALVEKAIADERDTVKQIEKSTPLVQTYIQNMQQDPALYQVPQSDEYSIARVDFGKSFSANEYGSRKSGGKGFFKGSMSYLSGLTKSFHITYSATGFMDMMFIDPSGFDQQHYIFTYVRRDFLGTVRTMVFDVRPKPDVKGAGRFFGRIWVEDQDGHVVRFNGSYTGSKDDEVAHYYHFDSWRTNVQPGQWLPTAIYVEESHTGDSKKNFGFRAQTYFWGYSLKLPQGESDNESIQVDDAQDQSGQSQDMSPLQAQRQWVSQAEQNVLDRLTQAGLLAPPSDFDKVLETVTNNVVIGNKIELPDDVHCRVLLTNTLESLSIGNTILVSKGLIDTLPSEEGLAAVLTFQLAHIVLGHHTDTRYAFNDRLLFPDEAAFQRINMNHTPADNAAAAKKAVELFNNSIYKDKSASVGLFFQQLAVRQKALTALLTPRLGDSLLKTDGTPWLSGLTQGAPKLNPDDLTQIAALPLNSRLRVDSWDDKIYALNVKPAALLSSRDKMPFEVTPIYYRLVRYQPPAAPAPAPADNGTAAPAAAPAQAPADNGGNAAPPATTPAPQTPQP